MPEAKVASPVVHSAHPALAQGLKRRQATHQPLLHSVCRNAGSQQVAHRIGRRRGRAFVTSYSPFTERPQVSAKIIERLPAHPSKRLRIQLFERGHGTTIERIRTSIVYMSIEKFVSVFEERMDEWMDKWLLSM